MPKIQFDAKSGEMKVEEEISKITIDDKGLVKAEESVVNGNTVKYYEYENGSHITITQKNGSSEISSHNIQTTISADPEKPGFVTMTYRMGSGS